MAHNLKFNKQLKKKLKEKYHVDIYPKYSNYDALEVPFSECIPSDYGGVMGVPITFLGKYDPNQFEIVGMTGDLEWATKECFFSAHQMLKFRQSVKRVIRHGVFRRYM